MVLLIARRNTTSGVFIAGNLIRHLVAQKGLISAKVNANDADEKRFARKALAKPRFRVVLHLEQPLKTSRLFPRTVDVSKVQLKLKQWLKALDAHPSVVDKNSVKATMPWSVV